MTETDHLAAEYVLGLLEGEDLLSMRARMAREPDLVAAVSFWETRLAPLMDELGGAEPGPELWDRIEAEMEPDKPLGEVVQLTQKLRFWQRAAAGAAMAAAAAFVLVLLQPLPSAAPGTDAPSTDAPLMANIPIGETSLRLAVTYLPDRSEMLVSASGLTADGVHDHELWLVPPEGELQSLGVVTPGEERRVKLEPQLAQLIADGSQMVLTREPIGGKPANASAGPVVAEGAFTAI